MPSIALLVIQEAPGGVSIDQLPMQNGTPLEREISKVIECGLRASQQYVMQQIAKASGSEAISVEGENIEKYVTEGLKSIDAVNWRKLLNDAGYKTL